MKQTQLILLIKKYKPDTPVIVTWKDAVDTYDEVNVAVKNWVDAR